MNDRFWLKVQVGDLGECWPFTGARSGGRSGDDYGYFRLSQPRRMNVYAHRLAFCLALGICITELTREDVVRHGCDNTICCNPMHLLHGTQAENAQDMADRGRSLRGERGTKVKLTEAQVHQVRHRLAAGDTPTEIARDLPVGRHAIMLIESGENWGWLVTPALKAA